MRIAERHDAGMEEYWATMKEFDERRDKYLEAERVAEAEGHANRKRKNIRYPCPLAEIGEGTCGHAP